VSLFNVNVIVFVSMNFEQRFYIGRVAIIHNPQRPADCSPGSVVEDPLEDVQVLLQILQILQIQHCLDSIGVGVIRLSRPERIRWVDSPWTETKALEEATHQASRTLQWASSPWFRWPGD